MGWGESSFLAVFLSHEILFQSNLNEYYTYEAKHSNFDMNIDYRRPNILQENDYVWRHQCPPQQIRSVFSIVGDVFLK